MASHIITFEEFTLPFMKDPYGDADAKGASPHRLEILEQMEEAVPKRAVLLGTVEEEIDHSPGLTWGVEDRYYLVPLQSRDYQWAIFRIRWDDNWSRYTWTGDARGAGFANAKDAGRMMIEALFTHWQIDLRDPDNSEYRALLKRLTEP